MNVWVWKDSSKVFVSADKNEPELAYCGLQCCGYISDTRALEICSPTIRRLFPGLRKNGKALQFSVSAKLVK